VKRISHDAARFVFCAHNAAVREIPNDYTHCGVFVGGKLETTKPLEFSGIELEFGHGCHLTPTI
jgi:hypothetical protein